jgi:DNA modification methylase
MVTIKTRKGDVTIICGDVLEEMEKLVKAGEKFNCIFADPDYNVGIPYGGKIYNLKFDRYIDWTVMWSNLAYDLLDEYGNFFIINYPKNNAYLRVRCLDDMFHAVHEYVWVYNTNIGQTHNKFTRAHRSVLHCTKSANNYFFKNNVARPYKNPKDKRIQKRIKQGSKGVMPYSWFYYDMVKNVSKSKTSHPCQIPMELSKLLISACTRSGHKVLILFAGSGNDVLSALNLGNDVTCIDISQEYCDIVEERVRKV